MKDFIKYILRWADDALIMSHRLCEYSSNGPYLEEDLAISNVALDYLGQAESMLNYAAELLNDGTTADDLAYRRPENDFLNCKMVELPNENFAVIVVRQFLYDVYNYYSFDALQYIKDDTMAAIGTKSLKEVTYHLKRSSEWMIRLGQGTEISHNKMQDAIDMLWKYTGEFFVMDELDEKLLKEKLAVNLTPIKESWEAKVIEIFEKAGLNKPESGFMFKGGRDGHHTEYMGYILAEMQYLPRAYPNAVW